MSIYFLSEGEYNELSRTMHLVELVEAVVPSSNTFDLSGQQISAFATTVGDALRPMVKALDERYEAAKGLSTIEGLNAFDLVEIIELLSGQRQVPAQRWQEIASLLERCAMIDNNLALAARSWRVAVGTRALSLGAGIGEESAPRSNRAGSRQGAEGG